MIRSRSARSLVGRTAVLGISLLAFSARAVAAAPEAAPPTAAATPTAATPVDAQADDLESRRAAADARAKESPTPDNHHEAAVLAEQSGAYAEAAAAYERELAARPTADEAGRAAAAADLARVRELARGAIADEGASTHRSQLDAKWAPKPADPPPPRKPPPPLPDRPTDDRIVRKWYFWVTLGAIVASAATVTAIAVKAARDDKPDSLDRVGGWPMGRWSAPRRR